MSSSRKTAKSSRKPVQSSIRQAQSSARQAQSSIRQAQSSVRQSSSQDKSTLHFVRSSHHIVWTRHFIEGTNLWKDIPAIGGDSYYPNFLEWDPQPVYTDFEQYGEYVVVLRDPYLKVRDIDLGHIEDIEEPWWKLGFGFVAHFFEGLQRFLDHFSIRPMKYWPAIFRLVELFLWIVAICIGLAFLISWDTVTLDFLLAAAFIAAIASLVGVFNSLGEFLDFIDENSGCFSFHIEPTGLSHGTPKGSDQPIEYKTFWLSKIHSRSSRSCTNPTHGRPGKDFPPFREVFGRHWEKLPFKNLFLGLASAIIFCSSNVLTILSLFDCSPMANKYIWAMKIIASFSFMFSGGLTWKAAKNKSDKSKEKRLDKAIGVLSTLGGLFFLMACIAGAAGPENGWEEHVHWQKWAVVLPAWLGALCYMGYSLASLWSKVKGMPWPRRMTIEIPSDRPKKPA